MESSLACSIARSYIYMFIFYLHITNELARSQVDFTFTRLSGAMCGEQELLQDWKYN
jgi:hypothetical protein